MVELENVYVCDEVGEVIFVGDHVELVIIAPGIEAGAIL